MTASLLLNFFFTLLASVYSSVFVLSWDHQSELKYLKIRMSNFTNGV